MASLCSASAVRLLPLVSSSLFDDVREDDDGKMSSSDPFVSVTSTLAGDAQLKGPEESSSKESFFSRYSRSLLHAKLPHCLDVKAERVG